MLTKENLRLLAIVIPAYKVEFFKATLESIASQTCQDFTLYIGNDASPHNLAAIVKEYEGRIDIVYEYFTNNLGGTDLVAHWARCVNLTQNEEWIWLFSDDDIMDSTCVEKFYKHLINYKNVNLLHFNINIIGKDDQLIKKCNPFPEVLTVSNFFTKRILFKINSTVVEYIFKKSIYYNEGGFESYDMAWCSDDATWIKFGRNGGIVTIPNALVNWRYSGLNISSNRSNKDIILRKIFSSETHIQWVKEYFDKNSLVDSTTEFQKLKWIIANILTNSHFTLSEKHSIVFKIIKRINYPNMKILASAYLFYWQTKNYSTRVLAKISMF